MLNRICELAAEVGKAALIIASKDEQIESMSAHIESLTAQINELANQRRVAKERMTDPLPINHPDRNQDLP